MEISDLSLSDVKLVQMKVHGDARGFFMETYREKDWRALLDGQTFIQDNQSFSAQAGTLRGLHYQLPPFAQGKLVQVIRGCIYDVAVDLRRASPSFGRHVGVELTAGSGQQLFVPVGFAHGFVTLEPDTIVTYKVTAGYDPGSERGIAWDDPDLGIDWPIGNGKKVELAPRDRQWPRLKDTHDLF